MAATGEQCDVAVVIPVFNSGPALPELVERLLAVLPTVAGTWRIVLVDDASRDDSAATAERLAGELPEVVALRNDRNRGQHATTLLGMSAAGAEIVVTMDDDLQHRPEDVPALVGRVREGALVATARFSAKQHGLLRRAAGRVKGGLQSRALGVDALSTFTAYRGEIAQAMAAAAGDRPHIPALTLDRVAPEDVAPVHLDHNARPYGRSNYGPVRSLRFFTNAIRRSRQR